MCAKGLDGGRELRVQDWHLHCDEVKPQQLKAIHLYIPAQYYSGKRFPLFIYTLPFKSDRDYSFKQKLSLNHPGVRFDQEDGYGLPLILAQPDRREGFPDISLSLQVFLNERKKPSGSFVLFPREQTSASG